MCAGRDPEARRIAIVRESDDQEQATMIAPDICTVARGRHPEDDRIASARWVPAVG